MRTKEKETKLVHIVFPGGDSNRTYALQVRPGENIKDIKQREPLLKDFSLFSSEHSLPCKENVELYPHVEDGDTFFASTVQEVGGMPGVLYGQAVPKLWVQRGWKRIKNGYFGHYLVGKFKFSGFVRESCRLGYEVYISNPPRCMMRHPEWKCFVYTGNDRYQIHFINRIESVDDAIINVERLLKEAYTFYND